MDRIAEQQQRFSVLVQQLQLPTDWVQPYFQSGRIDKLEIRKQTKEWIFSCTLPRLLPKDVYHQFYSQLKHSFAHLAQVDLYLRYDQTPGVDELVADYWNYLLALLEPKVNSIAQTVRNAQKSVDGSLITVTLPTEMAMEMAKRKKVDAELAELFAKVADIKPRFHFQVEENNEAMKAFLEQRAEEERALVEVVVSAVQAEKESQQEQEAVTTIMVGYEIKDDAIPIHEIQEEERRIVIQGTVFNKELRELKSGRHLLTFHLTDYTDSLTVKIFSRDKEDAKVLEAISDGMWLKVRGSVQHDQFARELVMTANDLNQIEAQGRKDWAEEKRVELHCHTPMSSLDGVASLKSLIGTAAKWGHKAIAVTDHGVVQAFPEAYGLAKKNGIKCILGLEAYVVEDGIDVVYNLDPKTNDIEINEHTEYVVFDVETTGLNAAEHTIIEIAAVKMKGLEIIDQWTELVDPQLTIGPKTTEITGITNEMLRGKDTLEVVLPKFKELDRKSVV